MQKPTARIDAKRRVAANVLAVLLGFRVAEPLSKFA
jgi:hypothetical protein